jgi:phosphatidylethanolamine/phosphatidyl-N-methylethanolamine N-methyltransferase
MSRILSAEQVAEADRRTERVYSVLARVYDGFFDWALGPGRRYAVKRLGVLPGDRVLEVGVGTGLSVLVYPTGAHVTGIDISEPMLERARTRVEELGREDVLLQKMDARAITYPDGHFDKLLAPYVISVVAEPEVVLREMVRVCRPGGTIIVVNKFQSDFRPLAWVERLLSPLSTWIGFRMDTPVSIVTKTPGMTLVRKEKVNLLGLWTLLEFRRS